MKPIGTNREREILKSIQSFMPKFYEDFKVVTEIVKVDANEMENLNKEISAVLDQFFINKSTWGLKSWEKITGLPVNPPGKTYEQRRSIVLSKLRGIGVVNVDLIKSVAESFANGEVEVIESSTNLLKDFTNWKLVPSTRLDYVKATVDSINHNKVSITLEQPFQDFILPGIAVREGSVYTLAGTITNPPPAADALYQNHAFLPNDWFKYANGLSDASIIQKVNELKSRGIKYQFCDIGNVGWESDTTTGKIDPGYYFNLARWIKLSKATDPNQECIAYFNDSSFNVTKMTDTKYINNLIEQFNTFTVTGLAYDGILYKADGIHLDFEPTNIIGKPENTANMISMLTSIKNGLPQGMHIGLDTPANYRADWTPAQYDADPTIYEGFCEWKSDFIGQLGDVLTQLNPMMYDKQYLVDGGEVNNAAQYEDFWYRATMYFSKAIMEKSTRKSCQINPSMAAYNASNFHSTSVENIKNAIPGFKKAIDELKSLRSSQPAVYGNLPVGGINGSGIFWWLQFIGPGYEQDRSWWSDLWLGAYGGGQGYMSIHQKDKDGNVVAWQDEGIVVIQPGVESVDIVIGGSAAGTYIFESMMFQSGSVSTGFADKKDYTINIRFVGKMGIPPDIDDIKRAIADIIPAHLAVEYAFSFITWADLDRYNMTWDKIDRKNLTWDLWDSYRQ